MSTRTLLVSLSLGAIITAAGACTFEPAALEGRQCGRDSDCADGEQCFQGFCAGEDDLVDAGFIDREEDVIEEEEPEPDDVPLNCIDDDDDGFFSELSDDACPGEERDCDDADGAAFPGNLEICDGVDNDCDRNIDNIDPENLPLCPLQEGVCEGARRTCIADGGTIRLQTEEECVYGASYVEEESFCRGGLGAGNRCGMDGANFTGPQDAGAILCDGLDNDCDGDTDEDSEIPCFNGETGAALTMSDPLNTDATTCQAGVLRCEEGATGVYADACDGQVLPIEDGEEDDDAVRCDGRDNDCDGTIDESCGCVENPDPNNCYDFPDETVGVGTCSEGEIVCLPNNRLSECLSQTGPAAETCDPGNVGEDNNCDGVTDNICTNSGGTVIDDALCNNGEVRTLGAECDTGLAGVCGAGTFQCDEEANVVCVPNILPGTLPETCGDRPIDNDCDGDFTDLTVPEDTVVLNELPDDVTYDAETGQIVGFSNGLACIRPLLFGECRGGTFRCDEQEGILECNGTDPEDVAGDPDRLCDGVNNDCDAEVDEDSFLDLDSSCGACNVQCAFGQSCEEIGDEDSGVFECVNDE